MQYYDYVDGKVVKTTRKTAYAVESVGNDTAKTAVASGEIALAGENHALLGEKCYCNAGTGGCKETISMYCTPEGVSACIQTLVSNCKR